MNKKGYFMKQTDDITRAYTSAKSLENITFDASGVKEGIYCIMMCG